MCKTMFCFTLFVFTVIFQDGSASFDCPLPAVSSVVYFDTEQINLMSLEDFRDEIKSPVLCTKENDPVCKDQLCCQDEIGCCYVDPVKHIPKCGCRGPGDSKCTHPAPIAIMGNSVCDDHNKIKIFACLRENRGHISEYTWTRNSTVHPAEETAKSRTTVIIPVLKPVSDLVTDALEGNNAKSARMFLNQFTVDQLTDKLEKTVIDQLIRNVAQRVNTGQSYGYQG